MPTAEEHLKQEVGAVVAGYLIQNAVLKAEVDRLKQELQRAQADGQEAVR